MLPRLVLLLPLQRVLLMERGPRLPRWPHPLMRWILPEGWLLILLLRRPRGRILVVVLICVLQMSVI